MVNIKNQLKANYKVDLRLVKNLIKFILFLFLQALV